jgi:hypothetical protein
VACSFLYSEELSGSQQLKNTTFTHNNQHHSQWQRENWPVWLTHASGATVHQNGDVVLSADNEASGKQFRWGGESSRQIRELRECSPVIYYEGYQGMKGWEQHGNLKLSNHSYGMLTHHA